MTLPSISVVIPTRNCAEYICDALDSVCSQTYRVAQTIVVDDASTDRTEHVVRSHQAGCIYLRNDRCRGPGFARNRGIEAAAGECVAFLDADDAWLPEKL